MLNTSSVSHVTIGFHEALKVGYGRYRQRIAERLARGDLDAEGVDVLKAMQACLDAATVWHQRHLDLLDERIATTTGDEQANYRQVRQALSRVPEEPPTSFHEAVQSLWFMYAFQRLMGNWSGIGRIDAMLGPYLDKDLAAGKITLNEARDILAHFWVKGTEWTGSEHCFRGSGDRSVLSEYYSFRYRRRRPGCDQCGDLSRSGYR